MKAKCPKCEAGFNLDISKIPEIPKEGIYVSCPKCKTQVRIRIKLKPKKEEPSEEQSQEIILCPECSHVNISSKLCVKCGKVFSAEDMEKLSVTI